MDPAAEMDPTVSMVLAWLPFFLYFLLYLLVLYFLFVRPLRRLSAAINRLTDAIEKRGA